MAKVVEDSPAVRSLRTQLQSLSEELANTVVVDSSRHKQCVDAANLESTRLDAEMHVEELKQMVQTVQADLGAALQERGAAEAEVEAAEEQLRRLQDVELPTEEVSLAKMREELALLHEQLAAVTADIAVYSALNAEIKRGSR